MTSIGKFFVAGAAAIQESTAALAYINFDFSLIKLEAPLEYRGLGHALSRKRKAEAEEGSTHITARKLGALFVDELPSIPNLTRAYGLRVSEIAENPKYNPKGSSSDGPFAEHVGADGTSIWAAATSGKGAMAVHLLACLLARAWSRPEAISIWSEIITARKLMLQKRIQEQEFHIGAITACQVEIPREKLSEWDASARSWLRTADAAMNIQQDQLMQILDKVGLILPGKPSVYEEVMEVWNMALKVVENLVSGVAQSVQSGEALFGLSAWHLYPDICAVGQMTTMILQKDSLIQEGGLMTIGIKSPKSTESHDTGISWSMPLSTLRYYGKPVRSRGNIGSSSTRVNLDRFMHVVLGSVLSTWPHRDSKLTEVAKFLKLFADLMPAQDSTYSLVLWPHLLSRVAERYLNSKDHEKTDADRYIALGRRRCGALLADCNEHPPPCFSLSDPRVCIELVEPDKQIAALRDMAQAYDPSFRLERALVRFVHRGHNQMVEYASVMPEFMAGFPQRMHRRWLVMSGKSTRAVVERSLYIIKTLQEPCGLLDPSAIIEDPGSESSKYSQYFTWVANHSSTSPEVLVQRSSWADHIVPPDERLSGWQTGCLPHNYDISQYVLAYGKADQAAVYLPLRDRRLYDFTLPLEYISKALASHHIERSRLVRYLECLTHPLRVATDTAEFYRSLMAIARAHDTYLALPEAEIDLKITSKPICHAKWAKEYLSGHKNDPCLERTISLACIAMFDTGSIDIDTDDLVNVMAISSTNTLYASEMLLRDPSRDQCSHEIRHVVGNIGKPGLAMLVSPRETILRDTTLETWTLSNHSPFDGTLEDNFASTSLHLSLTGYEQPLNTEYHGDRDQIAMFVEAVVSAYEGGIWVADLDLLHLFQNLERVDCPNLPVQYLPTSCFHDTQARNDFSFFEGITSIDNWDEYLDRPITPAIIRARRNWIARLAFAAIPLPGEEKLIIGSKEICWACAKKWLPLNYVGRRDRQLFLC